jgi:hypothetical protein
MWTLNLDVCSIAEAPPLQVQDIVPYRVDAKSPYACLRDATAIYTFDS